jgi:parvulin-like peptidyl-prolyl isomerase
MPVKGASVPAGRVVLKVGDAKVTEAEFESRISDIEPQDDPDKAGPTDKDRRKLGDDYASVLMLSQQAVANHLDSSPEVSRQLAVARMQVLSDAEFARLMSQANPTKEEVGKYYADHLSDYDQVHIRRLFIWKQRENSNTALLEQNDESQYAVRSRLGDAPVVSSQAARARADGIRQAHAAGTCDQKLADDLRKSGDGMLDPEPLTFPRGELPAQMEKAAFALKEGEWSEVQDTPASLLLIQLVKRDRRRLGEVSSVIEKELQGQKMEAQLDDLRKKAGIWLDEQYFGTAVAPVQGAQRRVSDLPSELRKSAKRGKQQ